MTYQSAYLNLELTKKTNAPKTFNFTLEVNLKEFFKGLITLFLVSPELKRSVAPGQIKHVVSRNLGQYPVLERK
ncbi:MAG: hypothetical protein ACJAT2_001158 [Bacteriovoracaceae bacterium]|jgi:hypothetical protein